MCGTTQHHLLCQTCCSFLFTSQPDLVESNVITSGVRGGADLSVHVVFKFDSHECDVIDVGALERTALRASSEAWDRWAVMPCFAAMAYE